MPDVCVIGHVTRDRIRTGADAASESAGGSAYYTSIALRRLGLEVGVVTKLAAGDRQALLAELEREDVGVSCADSRATTTFDISYPAADPDSRSLRVTAVADPFHAGDLAAIEARALHADVVSGREGFVAGTAQHDATHIVVGRERHDCLAELVPHGSRQCVELARTVEHHGGDGTVAFHVYLF